MKIVVLGSGSKGNCTYIETPSAKILIDAGLSMLQIKNRLKNQGIELSTLDAVFITHEHSDHINNLVSILNKTNATLFIEAATYNNCNMRLRNGLVNLPVKFIKPDSRYNINDVSVVPIKLSHDTEVCLGYLDKQLNTDKNLTFASITDTGYIPKKYFQILRVLRRLENIVVSRVAKATSDTPYFLRALRKKQFLTIFCSFTLEVHQKR